MTTVIPLPVPYRNPRVALTEKALAALDKLNAEIREGNALDEARAVIAAAGLKLLIHAREVDDAESKWLSDLADDLSEALGRVG